MSGPYIARGGVGVFVQYLLLALFTQLFSGTVTSLGYFWSSVSLVAL